MSRQATLEADLEICIARCALARASIDARIAALATEVRECVVVPICRAHRLEYRSSPSDKWWYFAPRGGELCISTPHDFRRYTLEELPQAARDALAPALELLGGELGGWRGATLADLIEDVDAADVDAGEEASP